MRAIFFVLFFIQISFANAQSIKTFAIDKLGKKDYLLKTEFFENGNLVRSNQLNQEGQIESTTRYFYTNELLTKTTKTFKIGHEYDYISEYAYDEQGRKIHQLKGNNLTGKWNSLGYNYNAKGLVDTVYFYQKNGDLTAKTVVNYQYNDEGQPTSIQKTKLTFPEQSRSFHSSEKITRPDPNTKIVQQLDENGAIIQTEQYTYNGTLLLEESIEIPGMPRLITKYSYNQRKRLTQSKAYSGDQLDFSISYEYDSKGRLIKKIYRHANNSFSGECLEYSN